MKWQGGRRSGNVEDRRGMSVGRGGASLGCGGLILVIAISLIFGKDPRDILQLIGQTQGPSASTEAPGGAPGAAPNDELGEFVSVVLADTEDTWTPIFQSMGRSYTPPVLVLFTDAVQSACGYNTAATGPFYCPADSKVYIDLGFYRELRDRFGAPGDFAQAYVIAHEIGHHVQNQLGISSEVQRMEQQSSMRDANALSLLLELQADCFAGVWANHAERQRQMLEEGDVEEGMNAAAAIGDDRMQRMAGQRISPDSWTHGSSEQRVQWFRTGMQTGDMRNCDTFAASRR
ncbi:MAG: KPN_02809 family neutral zinc metallopeptidase [Thermoanaerobaculia bacterium]